MTSLVTFQVKTNSRRRIITSSVLLIAAVSSFGCGVDVLTSTAVVAENQARTAKSLSKEHAEANDSLARAQIETALQHFRVTHYRLPNTLDELVPKFLVEVPLQSNGEPFAYDRHRGLISDPGT